ncbi:MAG: phytanoyl-CoA dioxygenase family protein [Planctomycetes bacterium]|nr:phytanoyl-CoA dioxygenase family protein [Planctomycetota bacterium]
MTDAAQLQRAGFARLQAAASAAACSRVGELLAAAAPQRRQHRQTDYALREPLERCPAAAEIALPLLLPLARDFLGDAARPIGSTWFDKPAGANWLVAPHQDLVLPFYARGEAAGVTGWTTKQGIPYALPPDELLATLLALRLHLDDCPIANGALAVIPGSHQRGRLSPAALRELPPAAFTPCPAAAGDVLATRPLLVHRSSPAKSPTHRRVLHVVFAATPPPPQLAWRKP